MVKEILQRSESTICCSDSDPDLIFGYLVLERPNIMHFIYVKKGLRRQGVMAELLSQSKIHKHLEGCEYTHLTHHSQEMWRAGKWLATYNPYQQRKSHEQRTIDEGIRTPVGAIGGSRLAHSRHAEG